MGCFPPPFGAAFLAGFLPALGAAAAAIRIQCDFGSIALRGSNLARALLEKREWLDSSGGPRSGIALGSAVLDIASMLSAETLDWREALHHRALEPPG